VERNPKPVLVTTPGDLRRDLDEPDEPATVDYAVWLDGYEMGIQSDSGLRPQNKTPAAIINVSGRSADEYFGRRGF
jgi:hypothetical protein